MLSAIPPLRIAQAGEHDRPQLWLQGPDHWPSVMLTPLRCDSDGPKRGEEIRVTDDGQRVSFARVGKIWYADWCEDGTMQILVESPERGYVEAAAEELRIRGVSPPGS